MILFFYILGAFMEFTGSEILGMISVIAFALAAIVFVFQKDWTNVSLSNIASFFSSL